MNAAGRPHLLVADTINQWRTVLANFTPRPWHTKNWI